MYHRSYAHLSAVKNQSKKMPCLVSFHLHIYVCNYQKNHTKITTSSHYFSGSISLPLCGSPSQSSTWPWDSPRRVFKFLKNNAAKAECRAFSQELFSSIAMFLSELIVDSGREREYHAGSGYNYFSAFHKINLKLFTVIDTLYMQAINAPTKRLSVWLSEVMRGHTAMRRGKARAK